MDEVSTAKSGVSKRIAEAMAACALSLAFTQCAMVDLPPLVTGDKDQSVVYALGSREGFKAPIATQGLRPACPALEFAGERFVVAGAHDRALREVALTWKQRHQRYVIAGYASPALPNDYARALSERRAQAVRQRLIEYGIEAADMQTVGYGSDFAPSSPSTGVVVIYQMEPVDSADANGTGTGPVVEADRVER